MQVNEKTQSKESLIKIFASFHPHNPLHFSPTPHSTLPFTLLPQPPTPYHTKYFSCVFSFMAKKYQATSLPKHVLAGGIAGAIEICIMYPTEFVKTQMQLQKTASGKPRFKNSLDCARVIVRERGPLSLYRGLTSLVMGTVPKTAVRFGAFGQLKEVLRAKDGSLSSARTFLAGALTGVIEATFVVTPVETMKTKLIHDLNREKPKYNGLVHGIRTIIAEEGFGGIYRGVAPTIMKQAGNQGVRFLTFGAMKKWMGEGTGKEPLPAWKAMLSGGAAGVVSVLATMPFDVVKTRMQGIDAGQYRGVSHCVSSIFKEEGIFAFWKGTAARMPRVAFGQSITLAGYDAIARALDKVF